LRKPLVKFHGDCLFKIATESLPGIKYRIVKDIKDYSKLYYAKYSFNTLLFQHCAQQRYAGQGIQLSLSWALQYHTMWLSNTINVFGGC